MNTQTQTPEAPKTLSPNEAFLSDVIITAVEGGIGYWSQVSEYDHGCDSVTLDHVRTASVTVHEITDERSGKINKKGVKITTASIAKAIQKILRANSKISLHVSYVRNIRNALAENDCGQLDSDDCGNIMQVAVLGDVVYG